MDPATITALVLAVIAMIGSSWSQVKHCKSGCCEIEKVAKIEESKPEK